MNILICDDDKEICEAVAIYLRHDGHEVSKAHDGLEALKALETGNFQLMVLDVMMPRLDGLQVAMRARRFNNLPILMLSAKSEDSDKILGLEMGADDYLTKPFHPLELVARVKSLLRRYTQLGAQPVHTGVYRTGGLTLDDASKQVTVDGEPVALTPIEYGILHFLIRDAGRVFSIGQIYEAVWSEPAYSPENTVAVHIRRLREKIEIDPKNPNYVKVVWGIGYRVEKIRQTPGG